MPDLSFLLLLLSLFLWSRHLNSDIATYLASPQDVHEHFRRSEERVKLTAQTEPKHVRSSSKNSLPKPQAGEKFIKGPIPLDWMRKASECGLRGADIGLLLWYAGGWQKRNPVSVSSLIVQQLPVDPKTCRRVLSKMEAIGLVNVERHRGRAPLITLLSTPLIYVGEQLSS